ncbi:MAG: class B sortase [Clostridia bacterium]|nr:class B sortase [Clostridia bacterium]
MKRNKAPLIALLVILVLAAGVGTGYFVWYWTGGSVALPTQRIEPAATTTAPNTAPTAPSGDTVVTVAPLPENPVDFATLQATNPDIYAWLYIPETNIDYPVACSSPDKPDDFYLDHNIYGQYEFAGTIYSEKQNGRTMDSRNTVMYGHNMLNGTMFRTLHYFEDPDFFEETPEIFVYTPGHILTYTVFAAYEYDNRHILNSFDFDNDHVWADYLAYATDPVSMNVLTRDVEVTTDDRILTLSTCVGTNHNARYLVQGVLTNDQPTA